MPVGCKPLGRLGNQLHIVASCIGIAHRMQDVPALPADWPYRPWFSIPDEFFGQAATFDAHELSELPPSKRSYLQCIDLWWGIEADIWRWFQPSERAQAELDKDREWGRWAVHVRRGDYHTLGADLYVPLWQTDYYVGLSEKADDLVVYTDDPEYCQMRWPRALVAPRLTDWQDLFHMARHQRHIIANSTFSYWGAMLSVDPQPTYPLEWFGPTIAAQGWRTEDFIPTHWRGIHAALV